MSPAAKERAARAAVELVEALVEGLVEALGGEAPALASPPARRSRVRRRAVVAPPDGVSELDIAAARRALNRSGIGTS